jgi:hypothetical protein
MKNLNQQADEIYAANRANGFYDNQDLVGFEEHQLFEIIKELGEASEAHKKEKFTDVQAFQDSINEYFGESKIYFEDPISVGAWNERFEHFVKDNFEDEIADTKIRCLDKVGADGLNVADATSDDTYKLFEESPSFYALSKYIFHITKAVAGYQDIKSKAKKERRMLSIILMLDEIAHTYRFDLEKHIELKLKYNSMRGKLHGKQY